MSDQGIFPLCEYKRAGRARRFLVVVAFCQRHDIYTHTCVYTDASRHLFKEEEEEEKKRLYKNLLLRGVSKRQERDSRRCGDEKSIGTRRLTRPSSDARHEDLETFLFHISPPSQSNSPE